MNKTLMIAMLSLLATGCMMKPQGAKEHEEQLEQAGAPYQQPFEQRELPELPTPANWQDVLQRAFLANGDLEAAYHEWRAANERVGIESYWPNSNVTLGFDYMFSKESMKAWDRTTLSAGFDSANTLKLPMKTSKGGEQALEAARVAGHRFETAKFDLQRRVLSAYLDLALAEEQIRIGRENLELLKLVWETAANRVQAGGMQQDLLKAQVEYQTAENELKNMEAEAQSMRAMLNGMLARDADAPLVLPGQLPVAREIVADDARLIEVALDRNPELAGLASQVAGREDALELAKMMYLPDISPTAAITGSVSQALGAMVMLPTNIPVIEGEIKEARAMLRAAEAEARQVKRDRAGSFVSAMYLMRNAERQADFFVSRIQPATEQVLESTRQAYSAGTLSFVELMESQRMVLDVRLMVAEARVMREKQLAELEALAGVDIETLGVAVPSHEEAAAEPQAMR